jgi:hypothetical protein
MSNEKNLNPNLVIIKIQNIISVHYKKVEN